MKIRKGFVSNSSSMNFCIIGIEGCEKEVDYKLIEELIKKDVSLNEYFKSGYRKGKFLEYYMDYLFLWAGINAEKILQDKNLEESKIYLRDYIKEKFNIEIPLAKIKLYYGNVGD